MAAKKPTKSKTKIPKTAAQKAAEAQRKARKKVTQRLTKVMSKTQRGLFKELEEAGDFDLGLLWRVVFTDLYQMGEDYSAAVKMGVNDPAGYYKRKADYLELLRKLALSQKEITADQVNEITINLKGLYTNTGFFDATGNPTKDKDG